MSRGCIIFRATVLKAPTVAPGLQDTPIVRGFPDMISLELLRMLPNRGLS